MYLTETMEIRSGYKQLSKPYPLLQIALLFMSLTSNTLSLVLFTCKVVGRGTPYLAGSYLSCGSSYKPSNLHFHSPSNGYDFSLSVFYVLTNELLISKDCLYFPALHMLPSSTATIEQHEGNEMLHCVLTEDGCLIVTTMLSPIGPLANQMLKSNWMFK